MQLYNDDKAVLIKVVSETDSIYLSDTITNNGITYQQWCNGSYDNDNVLVFLNTNQYSNKVLLDHLETLNVKCL